MQITDDGLQICIIPDFEGVKASLAHLSVALHKHPGSLM